MLKQLKHRNEAANLTHDMISIYKISIIFNNYRRSMYKDSQDSTSDQKKVQQSSDAAVSILVSV